MSGLIPTDLEAIDQEIAELLLGTPESTNRGRLMHLINAKAELSGGGGLPKTDPTVDDLQVVNFRSTISDQPTYYTMPAGITHFVDQSMWQDTLRTKAFIKYENGDQKLGAVGAKIEGNELHAYLNYSTRYKGATGVKVLKTPLATGHTRVWVGAPTYTDSYSGNVIITGKVIDEDTLQLALYLIQDDQLVLQGGVFDTANKTNNDINSVIVNAIPWGTNEILIGIYCTNYNFKQLSVITVDRTNQDTRRSIIYRLDDADVSSYGVGLHALTNSNAETPYLAVCNGQGGTSYTVYKDNGISFDYIADSDASGSSSNGDTVMSLMGTNEDGVLYYADNRGMFGQTNTIVLNKLNMYTDELTKITVALSPEMLTKYQPDRFLLIGLDWGEDTNATDAMIALPERGESTGYSVFSVYPDGSLTFTGHLAVNSNNSLVRSFMGEESIRAVVPLNSEIYEANYFISSFSNYADATVSNFDALRDQGDLAVRESLATYENILGVKGVYDPQPVIKIPYKSYDTAVKLPSKDAVLEFKPNLLAVIPKDAPVGTQWTIKFADPDKRETTATELGIMLYLIAEPNVYVPANHDPAFNNVGLVGGGLDTVAHIVKTSETTAKIVYL